MKKYRNIVFVFVVIVFVLLMLVLREDAKSEEDIPKPVAAFSTFSMYDIARHISQNTFELIMILPDGVDAHTYKPTPEMMSKIKQSALIVYSGAGLEPWTDGVEFKNRVVNMSNYVRLREIEADEYHIHANHDKQCIHNKVDPHYWLDTENMIKATNLISGELIRISPKNKDLYILNRNKYIDMLNRLDALYKKELNSCYLDTVVVNHNAFSYLIRKYGLNLKSLKGLSSEIEISNKDIQRVENDIRRLNVRTLFYEDFVGNDEIKSLAVKLNLKTEPLGTLATVTKEELEKNLTYEDIMKSNLLKISKALMCK